MLECQKWYALLIYLSFPYQLEEKFKENLDLIKEPIDGDQTEWYNVYEDGDLQVRDVTDGYFLLDSEGQDPKS